MTEVQTIEYEKDLDFELDDFKVDIHGEIFKYRDNPKLKSKDTILPYTLNHLQELQACKDDLFYFIDKYYKTIHQDDGLVNMKLRDYQHTALEHFVANRFNVCKWPRQSGKSTSFAAYVCWFILFNEHKNVVILANKEKQSKELLKRIKMAYENLPYWLQQGIISWNKLEFELENGCKVAAASTSSDSIRGESVALLIVDECIKEESILTVRSKKTGEVRILSIGDLYDIL